MSQAGGPSSLGGGENIGGVHFTVGAVGAEQATQAVNQTAGAVQNLGNTAQTTGRKVATANATGVAGFTAGLKASTKTFRDFTGAITGTIARFSAFIGIFGLVTAGFAGLVAGGARLFDWTVKQGKGLKELDDSWKAVRESQDKYSVAIEKLQRLNALAKGGVLPATIQNLNEERIKALQDEVEKGAMERARLQAREAELLMIISRIERVGAFDEDERDRLLGAKTELLGVRGSLRKAGESQRELNEFTKRIAEALAREMARAATEFFRKVGNEGADKFSGDRVLNGFVRIEDQLSIIALQRGGREQ